MLLRAVALAAMIGPLATHDPTAAACTAPDGSSFPLETLKPLRGTDVHLASGFGPRLHPLLKQPRLHTGIDWAAPTGTPVLAAGAGRIMMAGPAGDLGNAVVIDHGGGRQTLYAQLDSIDVRAGDCVAAGVSIGKVGSTGLSIGPHLHFEVHENGVPINPVLVAHAKQSIAPGSSQP